MSGLIDDVEAQDADRRREEEEMERVLQMSLEEYNARKAGSSSASARQPQNGHASSSTTERDLESLDAEIEDVQAQIARLNALLRELCRARDEQLRQIRSAQAMSMRSDSKGKGKAGKIDYNTEFEWSDKLKDMLKEVFGFHSFRLCQEAICNASIDGRDIVAIMPTGGGKSLGYQLPALMVPGCTLVISPLIALISDQIMHLHEAGVDAVMLTSATPKEESERIYKRLAAMASGSPDASDIKLCYVTPERLAKSKKFMTALDKLHRVKKLARFVVDEAHCVSSQGHDFRPDYQKLSTLREMYPRIPILALSATCPAAVLADLISTLRMPALTMGSAANLEGTVLFSTSLYRKNLHYHVLPKPSGGEESIKTMAAYILNNHRHDTGIVYCLTKKDAESVAEALSAHSNGQIKTGVYHADVPDHRKEALHRQWREGRVKVVCATIAFGLGIDKGDVRFVLHHTLSKSLDGFYQESGRAGRDGKDADCVLYYRPQDATRIAGLTYGSEKGAQEKVLAMLAFASDVEECRKIQFANYFNKSSKLSFASWATEEEDTLTRCGHCDNCTRPPETLEHLGARARLVAWQLLRVAEAAGKELTMAQLCDLARGVGSGPKARGKAKERITVDVGEVAGGKIELSKEQTEALCVRLLIDGYLSLSFAYTAYNVNVYVKPSSLAGRFTRHSRAAIEQGKGPAFDCAFVKKTAKARKSAAGAGATASASASASVSAVSAVSAASAAGASSARKSEKGSSSGRGRGAAGTSTSTSTPRGAGAGAVKGPGSTRGKRKRALVLSSSDGEDVDEGEGEAENEAATDEEKYRREMGGFVVETESDIEDFDEDDDDDEDEDEEEGWQTSLRDSTRTGSKTKTSTRPGPSRVSRDPQPVLKRARLSLSAAVPSMAKGASSTSRTPPEDDVIEISD